MIEKLLALDALVYPIEQQGDLQSVWERYIKNKDTFTIVCSDSKPIGYICAFPIEDKLYDSIKKEGLLFDSTIPPELIKGYEKGMEYNLYIISIVIHPDYQGSNTLKFILKGFADKIDRLKDQGMTFNKILANAITSKGYHLLQSLGFKIIYKVNDESVIMESKVETVIKIIRNRLENWDDQQNGPTIDRD